METGELKEKTFATDYGTLNNFTKVWTILSVAFLLTISSQTANALNDSIPNRDYRTVKIFGNECEVIVPRKFKKLKRKKLDHPHPYIASERSGFANKKGATIKFYCTTEVFPKDKHGIEVWNIMELLSAHIERKKFLEGGYVVVDRRKGKNSSEKNLYFIKYQYISPNNTTAYMLSLCLEHKGKILIGFLTSPQIGFIETYEEILFESLQFEKSKLSNQSGR